MTRGRIIALANQKGGVGKTTLAVHFASWLAARGKQVVVIDGDPQGNATSWLLDGDLSQPGLYRVIDSALNGAEPRRALEQNMLQVAGWDLSLLPGNERSGDAMLLLMQRPFQTLAKAIRPLTTMVDYVLLDMPPSKLSGFRQMLYAADFVVAPTLLERMSLEGVQFMAQTCQQLQRDWERGPRLLGIVPNMARKRTVEHREQMDLLVEIFNASVWPPIPLSIRVSEACSFGQTVFDSAPSEAVTEAIGLVCQRLFDNVEGE